MTCSKKLASKYVGRPGPPYGAQDCPNKRKRGNDGLMYESKPTKSGIYRWMKAQTRVSKKASRKRSKRASKKASRKRSRKAISAMTVIELKGLCRKKGIRGYSKLNKAQLVRKCAAT